MYPGNKSLLSKENGISGNTCCIAARPASVIGNRIGGSGGTDTGVLVPIQAILLPGCPECGGRLVRIGSCFSCLICGWGACD